jgi:uncharacterized protein YndB with AHSA1/START domain
MTHAPRPVDLSGSSDAIVLECDLPDSPQKVWKALTVPELLAQWLLPNDMRPEEGARFSFGRGSPGRIDCTVIKAEPHRLLQMSWRSTSSAEEGAQDKLDTVVTFELFPTITGGTLLRLVHSGFETGARAPVAILASGPGLGLRKSHVLGVRALASVAKLRWAA